ncbi:hypothetical protein GCM10025768_25520 [Microbacterium pseudoresistens]|uniref:Uncharacterized protein n=1 Tax=Microbacterium pseudoresistens TaxID=640634 RepID=A0A7Y9JP50_9MICO|nr:hypothetical protein [Microbacterium pseudoresistens]NYD55238.1 hypothetical protein [Microbacterium pseudoresistens]
MNTTLPARQENSWKHLALSQPPEGTRPLSIELPRDEDLRRLSLAERLSLRLALRLLRHARDNADLAARHHRDTERERLLAEYEAQRLRYASPLTTLR